MYLLYIDGVLFPVPPGRIVTEDEFENRIYSLIDGSRVSMPGGRGLRKISFKLMLPMHEYPFAKYESGFKPAQYFAQALKKTGDKKEPVALDIYRSFEDDRTMYLTTMQVLPEKIVITEDAEAGEDMIADITLREYRSMETKIAPTRDNTYSLRNGGYTVPGEYIVKKGDSLWKISKTVYGDGSKYTYIAKANGIKKPYTIYEGQKLILEELN